MRIAVATAALFLITACGTSSEPGPASESSAPASSPAARTTSSSAAALPNLKQTWEDRFDAIAATATGPVCGPAQAQTMGCAEYLTTIVLATGELDREIRSRSDSASYVDVLIETKKVDDASERYSKLRCFQGGGTVETCHAEAITILGARPLVIMKLTLAELKKK